MFLSRVPLNGARRGGAELIASPNKLHAAVEASFPPAVTSEAGSSPHKGRILWRIDSLPEGRSVWLYVVSPRKPDFTHLIEQGGWPEEGKGETREYDHLLAAISAGQNWHFRLAANPVRKVLVDKGTSPKGEVVGTIQGHVTADQQVSWLLNRSGSHGFALSEGEDGTPQVRVIRRAKSSFVHGRSRVTLSTAVFEGVLKVTDADLFRSALCRGIGRAKAFGCGLLTIAPLLAEDIAAGR